MDASDCEEMERKIRAWKELTCLPSLRADVYRMSPKVAAGRRITGKVAEFEGELPEAEDVREIAGGGTFRVQVRVPDERGRLVFSTSCIMRIAGEPKLTGNEDLAFDNDRAGDAAVKRLIREVLSEELEPRLRALERLVEKLTRRG